MDLYRKIFRLIGLTAICFAGLTLTSSCDGFVYDDAEECEPTYRLRFRYDMNLKWADAFAHEVTSVHVQAFDSDGRLVKTFDDKGPRLADEGYALTLDLPAGDYHLVAWGGTDNDARLSGRDESFALTHSDPSGTTVGAHKDGVRCALNRKSDNDHPAYSDEHLYSLFHGKIDVSLPESNTGETYDYTVSLTKNTNHIRIILNHLTDEPVNVDDYVFHIEDSNGLMDAANRLLPDETIRYRTWKLQNGTVNLDKDNLNSDSRALITATGAIADLTVGRMTADHKEEMKLTVKTKDGRHVATVPVIDYALLAKDYYEEAYGHEMTDQEFLDREDDYVFTLFLDKNNTWSQTSIYIHSWRVVIHHDYEI